MNVGRAITTAMQEQRDIDLIRHLSYVAKRPRRVVVPVRWDRVDDTVRTGVWCPRCLLPSAVSVVLILSHADTLRPIGRHDVTVCHGCCRWWFTPDNDKEAA